MVKLCPKERNPSRLSGFTEQNSTSFGIVNLQHTCHRYWVLKNMNSTIGNSEKQKFSLRFLASFRKAVYLQQKKNAL